MIARNGGHPVPFLAYIVMHPTASLLVWGVLVGIAQFLPLHELIAVAAFALALATARAPGRFWLILRRARWLLFSILLIFSVATPGLLLFPELGAFGPTREGLLLGLAHSFRLLVVLATLALLLQWLALEHLVAGVYGLLGPFRAFGLNRARVALRLMLVMHYVERAPRGGSGLDWLRDAGKAEGPDLIRIAVAPFRSSDYLVLAGLAGVLLLAAWGYG